jgi:hypothetical protein
LTPVPAKSGPHWSVAAAIAAASVGVTPVGGTGSPLAKPQSAPIVTPDEADDILRRRLHWRECFLLERLVRHVLRLPNYILPIPKIRRQSMKKPVVLAPTDYREIMAAAQATVHAHLGTD